MLASIAKELTAANRFDPNAPINEYGVANLLTARPGHDMLEHYVTEAQEIYQ